MNLEKRSRRTIKKKSISKQKHNLKGRKKKEANQIKQTIKPLQRPWEKIKFILPETTLEIDLLRIDAWKRQIEMINNFSKSNEENSHQDLKLLLAFIIKLNESDLPLKSLFPTPELYTMVVDTIFPTLAKNLFNQKYFSHDMTLEISNAILENIAYFCMKHIATENSKLLELLRYILDPDKHYYKYNYSPIDHYHKVFNLYNKLNFFNVNSPFIFHFSIQ